MNRDVKTIALVSAIFGLCTGIYGMIFSLYLDNLKIPLYTMGIIFSVSGLLGFLVTILLGAQSDLWGRKIVYSASLLGASISSLLVPTLRDAWQLALSKIGEDVAVKSRTAVHPTLIYEHTRSAYAKAISRVQGVELTLNATGCLIAGYTLVLLDFQGSFIALGLMLILALAIFQNVREPDRPIIGRRSLRETYRFDISRQLRILCAFNLVHGIGFGICHSVFIYTLFFLKKFAIDPILLSIILGVHHFTFGLPLLIVSRYLGRPGVNYKNVFILGNLLTGLPHIATALIPSLMPATLIWFIHDSLGAALYVPAQHTLTQAYSRDESRGKDVNMTSAFNSIGLVIGPAIGGYLAAIDISLPFLIGGMVLSCATAVIALLK